MNSLITRINVEDSSTGEIVKLGLDDIMSLSLPTTTGTSLQYLVNQNEAISYTGDRNLRRVSVLSDQIAYFEKVTLENGNNALLQLVNPNCVDCNAVTLYFSKSSGTQAKVNLDIKEDGYLFKGMVSEFLPSAYYVRGSHSDQVTLISERTYKRSNGAYPPEIFTDQELVNDLKAGNEASVSRYSESNWAFFLLNTINYNKVLLEISESVGDAQ